jgi:hypothetical protein
VKNTKPFIGKLEDRRTRMVLLGYEEGSKAHKLFDPCAGRVVVSGDVIFDEMAAWDWEDSGTGEAAGGRNDGTFTIQYTVEPGGGNAGANEEEA